MSSLRPPVIWVLEDEVLRLADLCELLALVYPGATISPYSEARTLEFATTFRSAPDLLISDLRMEGADGFGAIQSVEKFREKYPDTHIVINSGFAYHVQPRWALDSHFTFVPKGDPDDLLQTVNSILAAQGLQQAVSIRREADGSPAYADAPRLSRGWMAAGFGAVFCSLDRDDPQCYFNNE